MDLAFGRARADGAPAYDVGNVLRRNDVQILHPCRDPDVVQLQQKLASDLQSLIDIEAAVEMRVVDQTLPSHCRTRLFKINAHLILSRVLILGVDSGMIRLRTVPELRERAHEVVRAGLAVLLRRIALLLLISLAVVPLLWKLAPNLIRRQEFLDLFDAQIVCSL